MFLKNLIPGLGKKQKTPPPAPPPRKKILIVDDDAVLLEILRPLLESSDYQVEVAPDGAEGLKMIAHDDYDIILCDMHMPHLAGDMFYNAVFDVKPHLCKRFIFMTGHRADPRWDAFVRKIHGVMLWKPFEHYVLMETISLVLKKSETTQSAAAS